MAVSIDTCGSAFDTELGVYTLASGNLQLQANNDDDSSFCPSGTQQSRLIFTFQAGVQYFVVVVRQEVQPVHRGNQSDVFFSKPMSKPGRIY